MSYDATQGYQNDPFAAPLHVLSQQNQRRFYQTPTAFCYAQTPQRTVDHSPCASDSPNFSPAYQMQSPLPSSSFCTSDATFPFHTPQQRYNFATSPSAIDPRLSGGNGWPRGEGNDTSADPGVIPWQERVERLEAEEDDAHSQFPERIRRGGSNIRARLYDDDQSEDEDMMDDERVGERGEKEKGDDALGHNVGAMLDDNWETESDNPSDHSTAPSGGSSAGSRWKGWEMRTLLQSMFDLNVLDPNLKGLERDKVWIQVTKAVNTERERQNFKGTRTDGACKHAWHRVFKAHCVDQKISEIASGTDEEEGKWQHILDDLAALWNDLKDKGKKGKGKKEKEKCPSEKRRDKDLEQLKTEKDKDSSEEEELDADVSLTPRAKKRGRQDQATQLIAERSQGMIDAFSDLATKQQEGMAQRLKQEEDLHKAELAAMEKLRQDDRLAEDRRHDDLVILEREKMKLDQQKMSESLQRIRQMETKLHQYQQETSQRHEELQRDVRHSLQGQNDLKSMMATLLQRLPG